MTIKIVQKKLIRRRRSFQISKEDFIDFQFLGSGGFGTCCRAIFKFNNQVYCVKMINQTSKKKAALQSFEAETKTELFTFDHPNIVKLLAATPVLPSNECKPLDNILMTFEYVEGRNLQRLLEDEFEVIPFQRMCNFGQDIASALQYVHSRGIVHLDVKPSNVMVTLNDVCKLADFGCSQYSESDPVESESLLTGTFAYRAPELHRGLRPTPKCDVYALGVCLWQFWSRCMPFSGTPQHVVIYNVVQHNLRPKFNQSTNEDIQHERELISEKYEELAIQCWLPDADDRPNLKTILDALRTM